ncbi:hypothetical protein [Thalassobacillus cyri]|uniref:hypothetical protein n=1 Tax=Thalassobacillus cyri TaxID=571932 RepID=UPI00115FAF80|nr:hypothetical protein [Thalassobacillus cyri]
MAKTCRFPFIFVLQIHLKTYNSTDFFATWCPYSYEKKERRRVKSEGADVREEQMGAREEPPFVKEEVAIVKEEGLPIRREHHLVHKENMKKCPTPHFAIASVKWGQAFITANQYNTVQCLVICDNPILYISNLTKQQLQKIFGYWPQPSTDSHLLPPFLPKNKGSINVLNQPIILPLPH